MGFRRHPSCLREPQHLQNKDIRNPFTFARHHGDIGEPRLRSGHAHTGTHRANGDTGRGSLCHQICLKKLPIATGTSGSCHQCSPHVSMGNDGPGDTPHPALDTPMQVQTPQPPSRHPSFALYPPTASGTPSPYLCSSWGDITSWVGRQQHL